MIQYPPPPCRGRITVTTEDLACLDAGEFLNDVIIDFYLKSVHLGVGERGRRSMAGPSAQVSCLRSHRFLVLEGAGGTVSQRSHVFSSFFYKQLSRRRAAGENEEPSVP